MSGADAPFECWAVIRPGQRGLARAAAEAAAGDGDRVLHLIDVERLSAPRPLSEWTEEDGDVLWWRFPVVEPPYVGSPLCEDFPDYLTHWTTILVPPEGGQT